MQVVTQWLKNAGYGVVDDRFYSYIASWFRWYQGKVPSFHTYRQYNGLRKITRERRSLGMAKTITEDWANLELNEKVEIVIGDEQINEVVQRALEGNNFHVRGNRLIELAYALGTGAMVEYLDQGEVKIDYIRAGMIYPLSWDNGRVTECAFASERRRDKKKLVYLNIHRLENNLYTVENHLFERDGNALTETALPEGVQPTVQTGSAVPLFQLITPNLVNSIDPDCPMGISVYANAIDQLEGLDLVYDSYVNEFRLGKKRIIVPVTMAKRMMQEDGCSMPVFDDNDTEFYAVEMKDADKIQDINMELRYQAHEAAIQTALNLLSKKCGLGNDRYNFERGNVKTATEVVSEKSDLFQNLKKHELSLERALIELCRAVAVLSGLSDDFEVTVNFDDSIIEDKPAEMTRDMQQVRDGLMTKWEYRMKWYGEDEETARKMAGELDGGADDDPFGFGRGGG